MGTCCLKPSAASTYLEMPTEDSIANYRFTESIVGEGAFSTVRKGFDSQGRPVALKCVRLSEIKSDKRLLKREIRILQKVQHPSIVMYISCFQDPEHMYIVTELCDGGNLMEKVRSRGCLPECEVQKMCKSLLEGLAYLHALHICHH